MTIFVKEGRSGSWFDPRSVHANSKKLEMRLLARLKGVKAKAITLTYRRDDYKNHLDLYRRQQEARHIRRFIERLEYYLKTTLRGKWIRKMEFQKGGWIHWHMIIEYGPKIDKHVLQEIWGHGHVWINALNNKRKKYFCKYVSKSMWNDCDNTGPFGDFPGWIYAERPRSVKVIAVSTGFWQNEPKEPTGPKKPYMKKPYYTMLGDTLGKDSVKCFLGEGQYREVKADLGTVVAIMGFLRKVGRWYAVGSDKVRSIVDYEHLVRRLAELKRQGSRAPEGRGSFTLLKGRKPPEEGFPLDTDGFFSCFKFLESMGHIENHVVSSYTSPAEAI